MKNVPSNLSNFKSKVNKLDFDKIVSVAVDLSKLSDVLKNNVVEKDVCNAKIKDIEGKILDITKLVTNATLNVEINEVKNKIFTFSNLVTNVSLNTLTAVENEIPGHSKYITTLEFNKLTAENITARLKEANLATEGDIANFAKKADFDDELKNLNKKITSNKPKHVLVENESNELSEKVKAIPRKG